MPNTIRASLIGFLLAFAFEVPVDVAVLQLDPVAPVALISVIASLAATPLALWWAIRRMKRGYELLKWIAALSLAWPMIGKSYLQSVGTWAIALMAACVWCRVGALLMIQRKASKAWIEVGTNASKH